MVFSTTAAGTALNAAGFDLVVGSLQGGNATTGNISLGSNNLTIGTNNLTTPAYAGNISGSGNLTKVGIGNQTLGGNSTYTGNTTILSGRLLVNTAVTSGAPSALGNSTNPILLGDTNPADPNNAALLTTGGFTISRAITVQSGGTGTATLGSGDATGQPFNSNVTLNKNVIIQSAGGLLKVGGGGGVISSPNGTFGVTYASPPSTGANGIQILSGVVETYTGDTILVSGNLFVQANSFGNGTAGGLGNSTNPVLVGDTSGSNSVALFGNQANVTLGRNITVRSGSSGNAALGVFNAGATPANFTGNITLNEDVLLNGTSTWPERHLHGEHRRRPERDGRGPGHDSAQRHQHLHRQHHGPGQRHADRRRATPVQGPPAPWATAPTRSWSATPTVGTTNTATLLVGGAFSIGRNITVQSGSTGTVTLGGSTANSSTIGGGITLNKDVTFIQAAGGTANVTSVLSGAFNVTVGSSGNTGTVALSAANSYTGATTIANGTLSAQHAGQWRQQQQHRRLRQRRRQPGLHRQHQQPALHGRQRQHRPPV